MKKRILTTVFALLLSLGICMAPAGLTGTGVLQVRAAETAGQEDAVTHSLDEETFSELVDFIKEKWDAGELKSDADIQAAIEEGEEKFDFELNQETEKLIVSVTKNMQKLNLDSEAVAQKAKELYGTYGDAIAENAEKLIAQEAEKMGTAVSDALKEQLVEPAKEAAAQTAKAVAKNFLSDLKNSVVNFVKNIFHI